MFTFKPAPKNGSNGNGHAPNGNPNSARADGNGHSANGNGNGSENGHSAPLAAEQPVSVGAAGAGSNGHSNGNGNGHTPNGNGQAAPRGSLIAGWLGLRSGNGNGHTAPKPAPIRHNNHNGHKVDSVIGPGIHFKGTLTGSGSLRIDGTFDGTINIQGPLLITDGAKVTADVRAGAVSVGGSLKGDVVAGKVEILSTGRLWGDLLTTAFATEEGAFLRGQVRMEDEVPPAGPGQEASPEATQAEA
jgi:cytoskeletal protein CcmA (bactofilin family)